MATIELRPDRAKTGVWWLHWIERGEVVARIDQDPSGRCQVIPEGPHWSPMKSIGRTFDNTAGALREVQLYFERR